MNRPTYLVSIRKESEVHERNDQDMADDEVEPPTEGWVRTFTMPRRSNSCYLQRAVLNLDHDLGDEKTAGTGYDVLLWLEKKVKRERFVPPPEIVVHSRNGLPDPRWNRLLSKSNGMQNGTLKMDQIRISAKNLGALALGSFLSPMLLDQNALS